MGHSEENKKDDLEREKSFLSKKSQKEWNPDDIVDTKSVTDMSETIYRDHNEELEGKDLRIEITKNILELGHSEENKRDN